MQPSSPHVRRPGLLGVLAVALAAAALLACFGLVGLASTLETAAIGPTSAAAAPLQKEANTARSTLKASIKAQGG
jgi:hypothetical protein